MRQGKAPVFSEAQRETLYAIHKAGGMVFGLVFVPRLKVVYIIPIDYINTFNKLKYKERIHALLNNEYVIINKRNGFWDMSTIFPKED